MNNQRISNSQREYLINLSKIQAPLRKNTYDEEKKEQLRDYCSIRNYAKGLLKNPNDKEAKRILSNLILKLDL